MPSLRSYLLNEGTRFLMRWMFRGGKPVSAYRSRMQRMDALQKRPPPDGLVIEDQAGPVAGRWIRGATAERRQQILYLHGGAFVFRMLEGQSAMVASLCAKAGANAFFPFYRLAPENPFPAAPMDALAAYRHLLSCGHEPTNIVVMGDSAGGNLALVLLHMLRREGLPMPLGCIVLSPVTDMAHVSASWRLSAWRDPLYGVMPTLNPARSYQRDANALDPLVSPIYGDFTGFPPIRVIVGEREALLEECVGLVRKCVDSGIASKVQIWRGMPHVFMLMHMLPEAALAEREVVSWLHELKTANAPARDDLYRHCVEMVNVAAISHRLSRETNMVFAN